MAKSFWKFLTFLLAVKDIFSPILPFLISFFGTWTSAVIMSFLSLFAAFLRDFDQHEHLLGKFVTHAQKLIVPLSIFHSIICVFLGVLLRGRYELHPAIDEFISMNILAGLYIYMPIMIMLYMLAGIMWLGANSRNTKTDITRRFIEITS